ncbi:hypothetical protein GCM10009530_00820 [Microbispora corallina]|uniref:Uncharacterized protein n=1 Tax=Microbispora corallina TaxID=83302 RepID=A0ABQ4FSA2_9ACTN|nr:hypothetical protein [Microbispora corallina]GIH37690.1 hypothetical protein Mco01_06900 [Microbispora corallina]
MLLTILITVYWYRRRVHDRLVARLNGPLTAAYTITMAAFAFGVFLLPDHPAPVWVTALVAVSVVAGLPLVWGAWRLLASR